MTAREASHIAFFDLAFSGRTGEAIAALYAHLAEWPRDALVLATSANPNGLIGASGTHRTEAPDRRTNGQSRTALR